MSDLVTTPFGFESTAADVIDGRRPVRQDRRSSPAPRQASASRPRGRSPPRAHRSRWPCATHRPAIASQAEIRESTGNGAVTVGAVDLSDLSSVAAFVRAWSGPLDILVNNAGVMAVPELTMSPSGHEMQFATNHLGHFALAVGLHDALAAAGDARVVSVSSGGHLRSPVVFDDIDFAFRDYDPFAAYGQSKTANVLFAVEATRRWADDGITSNALMPGAIFDTALGAPRRRRSRRRGGETAHAQDRRAGCRDLGAACGLTVALPESAAATSRTATQARVVDRRGAPGPAASRATPSIRPTPNGCGTSRCG